MKGPRLMMIHDLPDPDDPAGRTHKEVNLAKVHAIPIGALVEFAPDEDDDRHEGVRMYVVHHHRDCDGMPLYALAADQHDTEVQRPGFANANWVHGISERNLIVIRRPAGPATGSP